MPRVAEEYPWERISVDGQGHDHSFVRAGSGVRTTVVNVEGRGDEQKRYVVSPSGVWITSTSPSSAKPCKCR